MFDVLALVAWLGQAPPPPAATAQPAGPPGPAWFVRNTTRVESWRFFEPNPGGGDPDYTFIANRLLFGGRQAFPRWEWQAAGQYAQFGNLPEQAFGPGPLGTGGAYFDASQDTASHQVYLKYLNARFKGVAPGLDLLVGRFGYASGGESPSGQPKIEAVKRQRVDSRLIGEFEWSIYQRSFDGARADWRRGLYHVTGSWLRPTQGGFEEDANVHVAEVNVLAGTLNARPGAWLPRTDAQVFVYHYNDDREVTARPDNTGLPASEIDVGITTFGATLASAWPATGGEVDTLLWVALQAGDWYGDDHGGWSLAAEAGYQFTDAAWKPWLRAGLNLSSGDNDPDDGKHGTFFQMLPTARKYSLSTVYTQMNLRDLFVQALLRPSTSLGIRVDLHGLALMDSEDRWYFGSGVTQRTGTGFGYGTRASNGETAFGTVFEGSADYTINPHWSVNAYAGWIRGGAVVRRLFSDATLTFVYGENVVNW